MRTMQEQLIEKRLSERREDVLEPEKVKAKKKVGEELSRKEWEDLMGVGRETYQKTGGKYRRRR